MKKLTLVLCALLSSTLGFAQNAFQTFRSQASAAYSDKKYQESGQQYERAFQVKAAKPTDSDFYNAACSWALAGEKTKAFQNLDRATLAGWDNIAHVKEDTDLAALHTDKRWQPMLKKLEATVAKNEANYNVPLKRELEEIYVADQSVRRKAAEVERQHGFKSPQMDSLWKEMRAIDDRNLPRVTGMIDKYGWPGNSLVGRSGSTTAFLVIQHSHLPIMQKYLPVMREAAAKGELAKSSLALLEDRVLTSQDKPQIYGSQLHNNPDTGKLEFFPIEDEAHVDERRATMNLGPLAEYAKGFGLNYVPVAKP